MTTSEEKDFEEVLDEPVLEEPVAPPWRKAWEVEVPKISIVVHSPESVGSTLTKYVVYKVSTQVDSNKFEVQRRFSEFVTLREMLVKAYAGLLIPPIPPKNIVKSETFLKTRTRLLCLFTERLASLPWVADDPVLRAFCSIGDWQKAEEKIGEETTGKGRAMWFALLAKAPESKDVEKRLAEVAGRLDLLQQASETMSKACTKAAVACAARADALSLFVEGVQPWRGESARWSALDQSGLSAETTAGAVAGCLNAWMRYATIEGPLLEAHFGVAVSWQALTLQAMRELVQRRSILQDELRKEEKHLAHLRQLKAAPKPQSKTSQLFSKFNDKPETSIDEQIAEADKLYDEKKRALDLHARALVYCELDRFRDDYALSSALFARNFFTTFSNKAKEHAKAWDNANNLLNIPEVPSSMSSIVQDDDDDSTADV